MKKFISVILAALMLVTVMPFAIFAADEYKEPANQAHVCHPTKDGKLDLTDLDMKKLYKDGAITITFKDGKDYNKAEYLVDGSKTTATRLTKGDNTVITIESKDKALVDFATLTLVVNGAGNINGGSAPQDRVTVATKNDLKLKVEVYGLDDKGADKLVYTSVVKNDKGETQEFINTKDLTEVVLNVFEPGYKVVITTVGTKEDGKGGPRLWEIDATTVKGADEYVHTWIKEITKFPALDVAGEYTHKCAKCGYVEKDGENVKKYEIPALTLETLRGGYLTLDDIKSFTENVAVYEEKDGKIVVDKDGNPVVAKDDDGNPIKADKVTGSDYKALFDGKIDLQGGQNTKGNFYALGKGGELVIELKNPVIVKTAEIYYWSNWNTAYVEFYNGDKLVGGNYGPDVHNEGWTGDIQYLTWDAKEVWKDISNNIAKSEYDIPLLGDGISHDFTIKDADVADAEYASIVGKTIDKIVIKFENVKNSVDAAAFKIGELKIGVHEHVYSSDLIKAANGKQVKNDPCKYTFAKEDAAKVVCRECGAAAPTATDGTITMDFHNFKETVDADGIVVYDYEYHKNLKKVDPTCGKDGSITLTCLNECANTDSPVYERVWATDKDGNFLYKDEAKKEKIPVLGKNNTQLYLGVNGERLDGTEITDWSKVAIQKDKDGNNVYNKKTCSVTLVKVLKATNKHANAVSTVRVGKYPTCGTNGTAYVICTDCKNRVDVKTVNDLLGMKLAADLVDYDGTVVLTKGTTITVNEKDKIDHIKAIKGMNAKVFTIDISYTEENTGKAITVRYKLQLNDKEELVVASAEALASGYHTMGYKSVVASTYTKHGIDGAYCTKCGAEIQGVTKQADLLVPNAKVRFVNFSLRTAEFEGVRGTFSLNNEVLAAFRAQGYNVRVYMVVTNDAGVSKEVQVYGAGAKAPVSFDGKFHVVVKGGAADETFKFAYRVVLEDIDGTAENVVELASASIADVKAAK